MAVRARLGLRQTQRLSLTPEMRQSLGILRMGAAELAEFLAREAAENPFIVLRAPRQGSGGGAFDLALATVAARPGLIERVAHQLRSRKLPAKVLAMAEYLAGELRDDGYLDVSLEEVAESLDLDLTLVAAGLQALQDCEPAGIGARDLAECMELQLLDRGLDRALARGVVQEAERFRGTDLGPVARKLGIPVAEARRIAELVRGLVPHPVSPEPENAATLLPDVRVRRGDAGFEVTLTARVPRLSVDRRLSGFAADQRTRAEMLARAVRQRGATLLAIARNIVDRQEGFLTGGPDHLRPMLRREVAEALGIHPSTLGRAVGGKGLEFEGRVYPLSSLFSNALTAREGEISAIAVRRSIARLVAEEPALFPLSDAEIRMRLIADGVDIAPRTVAKYRQGMKIPSSYERRRHRVRQGGMGGADPTG